MKFQLIAVVSLAACVFAALFGLSLINSEIFYSSNASKMTDDERAAYFMKVKRFSQPAIGGGMRFGDHCADCHGRYAEGTVSGPGLMDQAYSLDYRDRETFHSEVAKQVEAHRALIDGGNDDINFNGIEMMAKYLRELRRAGGPPPTDG